MTTRSPPARPDAFGSGRENPRAVAVWPDYDGYQKKTSRAIPLLVLEPM
ncbi:MAG TPA: nitroreductase/quinone reductase family protein [Candidatus Limnocylindria bacterium]|nr:nitroreductase/quinone reductase family protein [Candidatus Limnocylindria bacterium]